MNPYHTVPTLKDGDFSLWESNSVLRYLCRKHKLEKYYPSDAQKASKIDQIMDYRQCILYKKVSAAAYPLLGFAGALDEKQQKAANDALSKEYEMFEKSYLAGGKFAGGFESVTIADMA